MYLRRAESNMKQRCDKLECRDPPAPKACEHVHHDGCFEQGPKKGEETGDGKQPSQESMAGWIDAIQDDGQVRQGLAHNVERAPDGAEDEFDVGIPFVPVVQADANRSLTDDDGSNVVEDADGGDSDPVEQFKHVDRDEDLGAHH